tara:strand:- start:840 stop:1091 length:252 start_codon:yes stop_codon:yes gene_type:complete
MWSGSILGRAWRKRRFSRWTTRSGASIDDAALPSRRFHRSGASIEAALPLTITVDTASGAESKAWMTIIMQISAGAVMDTQPP